MKLIYLWERNYHKINANGRARNDFEFDDGFVLSSDYIVEFSYNKGEIYIEKNSTVIENFFGKNIIDIIGIVGENGAGKTTVLSMLASSSSYIRYEYDFSDKEYIKIFEEDAGSLLIYFKLDKELKYNGNMRLKIKLINLINPEKAGTEIDQNYASVFISNNFEWRDFYGLSLIRTVKKENLIEYNFAKNLQSLSFNLEHMYGAELNSGGYWNPIKEYGQKMEKYILDRAVNNQLLMLVNAVRSLPPNLRNEFSGIYDSFKVGVKPFSDGFDSLDNKQFNVMLKYQECVGYRESRYLLFTCYKLILCEACYFFDSSVKEIIKNHFDKNKEEIVDIDFLSQVITKLKTDITYENNLYNIEDLKWFQQLKNSVVIFQKYKDERLYIGDYKFFSANGKRFLEFFSDIFNNENIFFQRVLTFKSYSASTGESVLAYFFAYIYDMVNFKTERKNIAIFIDEIDATLHPRWQQSVLSYLIKYLNSFEGYRFQIIFTTHSPIVLSDLTEERIIRLRREKNKVRVISDVRQTFGANIMRLYYDDFFMEEGSIGEIAKTKIKKVVNYLEGKDESVTLEEAEYIIAHIGEPTVKKQLLKKLNELKSSEEQELMKLIKKIGVHKAFSYLSKRD